MDVICVLRTDNGDGIAFRERFFAFAKIANLAPFLLWGPSPVTMSDWFAGNSSLLISKSGLSLSLSQDHRCGGALNANAGGVSATSEQSSVCTLTDMGRRASLSPSGSLLKPLLPGQSRALALSRWPINASFTGMPQGCVRKI